MAATAATASTPTTETPLAFALNDAQYEFVFDDRHKYVGYVGGLGAGKSFAGGVKAVRKALEYPGSLGLVGAPNYPQLRDSTMRSFFEDVLPWSLVAEWRRGDGILRFKNGSEILFRSLDEPDSRRGPNLTWFWLDEGPLCGYYAWQVMKGRLRQRSHTEGGEYTGVQGWWTGTPHGEDEFAADFENFENTSRPRLNHSLYRASTRENLHNLPPGYIEDLGYAGKFALQEVEGLFVTFEGLVYEFHPEWHSGEWPGGLALTASHAHKPVLRIGGIDWGFTNPAVALPMWVDGDDRVYVLDEFYQRQAGLDALKAAVFDYTRRYGIELWYCGPDEPEHILELSALFGRENTGARAIAANDEINAGIETVRRQMTQRGDGTTGLHLSARCVHTRAEFRTYSYQGAVRGGKRDPDEKPIKKMDHAMDAARYALHTALGGKTKRRDAPDLVPAVAISDFHGHNLMGRVF